MHNIMGKEGEEGAGHCVQSGVRAVICTARTYCVVWRCCTKLCSEQAADLQWWKNNIGKILSSSQYAIRTDREFPMLKTADNLR